MTTLEDVRVAAEARLREQSGETLNAIKGKAVDCIVELHKHGSTVQKVAVQRDHVTIDIDRPSTRWLRGSIHVSRIKGEIRYVVMVASLLDCQVQWVEEAPDRLLKRAEV